MPYPHALDSTSQSVLSSLKGLYDENGPPTADADLIFMSIPNKANEVSVVSLEIF